MQGATKENDVSKNLCLCVLNLNIEPQSIVGFLSSFFAPATFSIQYGFNYLNNSDADNFGVAKIGFSKEFVKNNLEINIMYGKYLKNDSQNYYLGIGCNKNFKLNKS